MKIAIVAGGKLDKRFLKEISQADMRIGVDRGAWWLVQNKLTPDVALGDFDSVTKRQLQRMKTKVKKVLVFPPLKDATDLELAVDYAIRLKPKEVIIFGGIGTRLDHTMAAVHLLEKLLNKRIKGAIVDEHNEIVLVKDFYRMDKKQQYRYLSLLPHTQSVVVSLSGFAYPLVGVQLKRGTSRGISNELTGKRATIKVHEGMALVIKSRD